MRKIAQIINSCQNCPHFVKASSQDSMGKNDIAICGYETEPTDDAEPEPKYALLVYMPQTDVKHFTFDIPDNCPLETYNEK